MPSWDERYEPVIGLEVHAQLLTNTKAFCGCSTRFGSSPNSNVCPVCLGMPGTLPVLNDQVVEYTLRMGLATGCTVAEKSIFARKNYFYPDLPKGYQISQYEEPICTRGFVDIELEDATKKRIGITRIHMEEDAGKSIHDIDFDTLVDFNRCGVPLIEIVSEPDIRTPREAYWYLHKIRQLVTYLGICDGNMEEGSLRCDANVSVRKKGEPKFGTKTEVKNMNSFRFVEKALEYEIGRQIELLESGGRVIQQTMLWDSGQGVCLPMRSKEEAHDYRYFPDPDLTPVVVDQSLSEKVRKSLPEFPTQRRNRLMEDYKLPKYDADILTAERTLAEYFDATVDGLITKEPETVKLASNWIMTEVLRVVNERHIIIEQFPISPSNLAGMINTILDGTISSKIAKDVFADMLESGDPPRKVIERKGLLQVSDTGLIETTIDKILAANGDQVEKYLGGKKQVYGFFVGETMKAMAGKANPKIVNEILQKKLDNYKK
jgi:aspartyl-tRNA(Asn)/glutamyl-tRNA(Gln) amidotransferase subunit B